MEKYRYIIEKWNYNVSYQHCVTPVQNLFINASSQTNYIASKKQSSKSSIFAAYLLNSCNTKSRERVRER